MRVRIETFHREAFHCPPGRNDVNLKATYGLCVPAIEELYEKYPFCFPQQRWEKALQFLSYCKCPTSSDIFFCNAWGHAGPHVNRSVEGFKSDWKSSLSLLHENLNEIVPPTYGPSYKSTFPIPRVAVAVDCTITPVSSGEFGSDLNRLLLNGHYQETSVLFSAAVDIDQRSPGFAWFDKMGVYGSTPEIVLCHCGGLVDWLKERNIYAIADRLYSGLDYPEKYNIIGRYKSGTSPTHPAFRAFDAALNSKRAIVENCFGRLKSFNIMSSIWRGELDEIRRTGYVLANLVNIDCKYRPLRRYREHFI